MNKDNMAKMAKEMRGHIQNLGQKFKATKAYLLGPEFRYRDVKTILYTHRKCLIKATKKMKCVIVGTKNTLKMMMSMSEGCARIEFLAKTLELMSSEWEAIGVQNQFILSTLAKRNSSKFKYHGLLLSKVVTMQSDEEELVKHRIRLNKDVERLPDKET